MIQNAFVHKTHLCTIVPMVGSEGPALGPQGCTKWDARPWPLSSHLRLFRTPWPPCLSMTYGFCCFVHCGNAGPCPASPGPTLVLSLPSILSVRGFRVDTLEFWPASHGQLSLAGSRTLDLSYSFAYKTSLMTRGSMSINCVT